MGQLVPPRLDASSIPTLWIRRGKGAGGSYQSKVGRRCLNEAELLQARRLTRHARYGRYANFAQCACYIALR